jgi:hypothetical protein
MPSCESPRPAPHCASFDASIVCAKRGWTGQSTSAEHRTAPASACSIPRYEQGALIVNELEKRPSAPPRRPTLGEAVETAFGEYQLAVGKVAHAWNVLHESLGVLFVTVSAADKVPAWAEPRVALAIWYAAKSDRVQRDMLRAAVNANSRRWEKLPKALDDLKWLLDRCDELAEHRNNAVHAPCAVYIGGNDPPEMGPAYFAAQNPRAKNLVGKELLVEFAWCERYAQTLREFIQRLENSIRLPDRYPWPDRPSKPTRKTKP